MKLEVFIDQVVSDIRSGIKRFNDFDDNYSIEMPYDIEFETKIMNIGTDSDPILIIADQKWNKEISTIKFKVNTVNFRGTKALFHHKK
jgi:hypothetical protein